MKIIFFACELHVYVCINQIQTHHNMYKCFLQESFSHKGFFEL